MAAYAIRSPLVSSGQKPYRPMAAAELIRRGLVSSQSALEIPRWYVVHTKYREEERADNNLRSWEVLTFYPQIRARRVNQFSGKITELAKPLFPGYLFARFDASKLLSKVHYTRGV